MILSVTKQFLKSISLLLVLILGLTIAYPLPNNSNPESADILVVGGTPSGIAAALAAAREGQHVILIEERPYLGSILTSAMLNTFDMDRWHEEQSTIHGIFDEFYHGLGLTFDPIFARHFFLEKIKREPLITLHLNTKFLHAIIQKDQLQGAWVSDRATLRPIVAKVIIDATDDANVAADAKVPYSIGRQASGVDLAMQPATLLFRLKKLDWSRIYSYIEIHEKFFLRGGFINNFLWGYPEIIKHYHPRNPKVEILDLNMGRILDGSVWINSVQIFDVDGTDTQSCRNAYFEAAKEIPSFINFLRAAAPGFEQAELAGLAPELYIRETRHMRGLYVLTARDILRERIFSDRIAVASYPIDLHPYHARELNPFSAARHIYTIPLRSLITRKIDNLFVASRSFSATYEAAGSARIIPTTVALGQAAGVAASVCVEHSITPVLLAKNSRLVKEVQDRLLKSGAQL